MDDWSPVVLGSVRGVPVHADAVPVFEEFLGSEAAMLAAGPDPLSLRVSRGDGKSAGFPIRDTRRVCRDLGLEWGYPEEPEVFRVVAPHDAVLLRYRRVEVPVLRRSLSRGDYGHDVRMAQEALAGVGGYGGEISGRYTNEFMRAVRVWQGARGVRVTGDIDRVSWKYLLEESNVYSVA